VYLAVVAYILSNLFSLIEARLLRWRPGLET
jgi:ABC-type nitrate/sulfonate/bicarbonate transport system permease component